MLIFTKSLRVCLALAPVDLRRSFEGLAAVVTQELQEDERSSQVFVFTNKRKDRVRMLYWDGSGLWLMTKRLEVGTFAWPKAGIVAGAVAGTAQADLNKKLAMRPEALEMLLAGIELKGASLRPWYEVAPSSSALTSSSLSAAGATKHAVTAP